ncbi:MAG: hypothetical protein WC701_09840 [Kiritimatiellales bacterium]|jgi:hypothetical protein
MNTTVFKLGSAVFLAAITVSFGATNTWVANVPAGAVWSNAANWSAGVVPATNDTANFANTQSITYSVDVSGTAVAGGLTLSRSYTFDGTGALDMRGNSAGSITFIYNSTAVTSVFNTAVNVDQAGTSAGSYATFSSVAGGKIIFNNTVRSTGTVGPVNLTRNVDFNGDIDLASRFRMNTGVGNNQIVSIGGSGTTRSVLNWILTGDLTLNLNRSGAYTTDDRYMNVELARVYLGAANALAVGTNVRFKNAGYGFVAQGFNQDFGWLDVDAATTFDMGGSKSVWTFADSSAAATVWGSTTLTVTNAGNATIRFAIDSANSGTGLSAAQIGKIVLDGKTLAPADTRTEDGYLYITPQHAKLGLFMIY